MIKIQYGIHLLLHSKNKFLINLIIYFFILLIYNIYLNNMDIVSCMNRETPIVPKPSDAEIIAQLSTENIYLRDRVTTLERELRLNIERFYTNKNIYESHIKTLEENQGHLIAEIRSLKDQASEASDTLAEIAGNNLDFRSEVAEKQCSCVISKRNFEEIKTQYEEANDEVQSILKKHLK